jgi:hypothetical protein
LQHVGIEAFPLQPRMHVGIEASPFLQLLRDPSPRSLPYSLFQSDDPLLTTITFVLMPSHHGFSRSPSMQRGLSYALGSL